MLKSEPTNKYICILFVYDSKQSMDLWVYRDVFDLGEI